MEYINLFSPLKVNHMMLRNRIVCAPMGIMPKHDIISSTNYGGMSAWDRSMGGSALVHIPGEMSNIFDKYALDATKEWINVAKQDGAKVSCELGLFSMEPDEEGFIYGPMEGIRFDGRKMKAYTMEKMQETIDDLVDKCVKAKKIGFDTITLHFGHDSLCSQFLSPIWNQRNDAYGGTLENRCRFSKEALEAIRKAVGKDYPLILRISRELKVEETYTEEDMLYFLQSVQHIVDMVNISCGMDVYYEANVFAVPTIFSSHNYNAKFAKTVKEQTSLLVCLVGAIMDYKDAEQMIADGVCDCCMFGRSMIADPYFPKKLMNHQEEDVVPCIRCMHCYHIATKHENVQCSVNPRFRREDRMSLQMPIATKHKHVVVIGGGPAGMVSALSASKEGHRVTLIEKNHTLGGLLHSISKGIFKEDLRRYYQYLLNQIHKSNIQVILGTMATREMIEELKPDRLIIAIGSQSRELIINGYTNFIDTIDAIDNMDTLGKKVVIIGGGSAGVELALELQEENHEVVILEKSNEIAANSNYLYKLGLQQYLKEHSLNVKYNVEITHIDHGYLMLTNQERMDFDSIINCTGRQPKTKEAMDYYGICADTVMVGDCEKVGSIVDATNIAYFVGRSL